MCCYSLNISIHRKSDLKIFSGREDMANIFYLKNVKEFISDYSQQI